MRTPHALRPLGVAILLSLAVTRASTAQVGLLVVAHGADSTWNARVDQTVSQVQWGEGPVRVAYLMGAGAVVNSWDAGVQGLVAAGARSIVVVPLMVSTAGEHVTQIRYYAGEVGDPPAAIAAMGHDHHATLRSPVPIRVTSAIDAAPELGEVLVDRWNELAPAQRSRTLVLVAHGPSDDAMVGDWLESINLAAAPLIERLGAANLRVGLLRDDAAPPVRAAAIRALRDSIATLATRSGDSVTVMTVLVSSGSINRVVVPRDLDAMPMRYVGAALAPHPALARWIERIARSGASTAQ